MNRELLIGDWWPHITNSFEAATAAIEAGYFKVRRYDADPAYLERVYCYELYHQLRIRLDPKMPYVLHGELDKGGHDYMSEALEAGLKPDFLIHDPGYMDKTSNLLVAEVKTITNIERARKDIGKMERFLAERVHYAFALCLVYGECQSVRLLPTELSCSNSRIVVAWHRTPGIPLQICFGHDVWFAGRIASLTSPCPLV